MEAGPSEEVLSGGAQRHVVRVGDTVRVEPHERGQYVADLLIHLERVGFEGAPRWLSRTSDGHEVLTFIEGTVPRLQPYDLTDDQIRSGVYLVRRFHDAVAGTSPCAGEEGVCHGDLGPHNMVFRHGFPVAIIDWDDQVGPGRRAADVADANSSATVRRNRPRAVAAFTELLRWLGQHESNHHRRKR